MFPSVESVLAVSMAGFALSATPGPSMLYVLSRTIGQGRAAGIASAVGLCLGGMLLALATALGLAAVMATNEVFVTILRSLGAAYLLWLGMQTIRAGRRMSVEGASTGAIRIRPILQIFGQGVLVELLNPKTILFFALFLPPFISSETVQAGHGAVMIQLMLLGMLIPITAVPSDLLVAFLGNKVVIQFSERNRARSILSIFGGVLLISIAIGLIWDSFGLVIKISL